MTPKPFARNDKGLRGQSSVGKTNTSSQNSTTPTDPLTAWHRLAAESVAGRRADSLRKQALGKHGEVE
jgi:hypothetical protein